MFTESGYQRNDLHNQAKLQSDRRGWQYWIRGWQYWLGGWQYCRGWQYWIGGWQYWTQGLAVLAWGVAVLG